MIVGAGKVYAHVPRADWDAMLRAAAALNIRLAFPAGDYEFSSHSVLRSETGATDPLAAAVEDALKFADRVTAANAINVVDLETVSASASALRVLAAAVRK